MSRNDGLLVTGLSSAADRRLEERRKLKAQENKSQGARVKPGAQYILDAIAKEKAKITDIEKVIINWQSQKHLEAQILARYIHLEFLNSLNTKFTALLRAEAKDE